MINPLLYPKLLKGGLVVVALFIGAYWFWNNGYDIAESKNTAVVVEQREQALQTKERVRHVEQSLDDSGVDAGLYELGIMRRNADR